MSEPIGRDLIFLDWLKVDSATQILVPNCLLALSSLEAVLMGLAIFSRRHRPLLTANRRLVYGRMYENQASQRCTDYGNLEAKTC